MLSQYKTFLKSLSKNSPVLVECVLEGINTIFENDVYSNTYNEGIEDKNKEESETFVKGGQTPETIESDHFTSNRGDVIKVGDYVKFNFAGGPSDMPEPWKLEKVEYIFSTVNYKRNLCLTVKARNGKVEVYKFARDYSPRKYTIQELKRFNTSLDADGDKNYIVVCHASQETYWSEELDRWTLHKDKATRFTHAAADAERNQLEDYVAYEVTVEKAE